MTIRTLGVIGAGTMGNGIAQAAAQAGLDVVMQDIMPEAVERGLAAISTSLDRLIRKEKLDEAGKAAALARIRSTTDVAALKGADLVIEAATERESVKAQVLRNVEAVVRPDAILATNTSSISITRLAASLKDPSRFVGMHFFNPVPMMALVEIISGLQTSQATFDAVTGLAKTLGKTPISVRNAPGFVVNRLLCPMINEAVFTLQDGVASAVEIDEGMKLGCNHPIGPLALADLIGLDVVLAIMEVLHDSFSDPKYRPAPLLREMVMPAAWAARRAGASSSIHDPEAGLSSRLPRRRPGGQAALKGMGRSAILGRFCRPSARGQHLLAATAGLAAPALSAVLPRAPHVSVSHHVLPARRPSHAHPLAGLGPLPAAGAGAAQCAAHAVAAGGAAAGLRGSA